MKLTASFQLFVIKATLEITWGSVWRQVPLSGSRPGGLVDFKGVPPPPPHTHTAGPGEGTTDEGGDNPL